jgi:hypothetical protein
MVCCERVVSSRLILRLYMFPLRAFGIKHYILHPVSLGRFKSLLANACLRLDMFYMQPSNLLFVSLLDGRKKTLSLTEQPLTVGKTPQLDNCAPVAESP